jgi:hydrogenase maturation protease
VSEKKNPSVDGRARENLLVVGVGNTLREDDGVGIDLLRRLRRRFGPSLTCMEVYELDIVLAETIAGFSELLVIDARVTDDGEPYQIVPLQAKEVALPQGGFVSHVFDWGVILALSRDCFGGTAEARLLGVSASHFGLSEELSPACAANAEKAFQYLLGYCSSRCRA